MKYILALMLMVGQTALGHEGPHGPDVHDGGKYGGQVVAVIKLRERPPQVHYKAEFVRNEGSEVRLYLYDKDMKNLPLTGLPADIDGVVETKWKGKHESQSFKLTQKGDYYAGQAPAPKRRPFNLEAQFKLKGDTYFAGLENQD